MEKHAPLAPSSAPQWGRCSGSVMANAMVPNMETDANREGTAAHWVLAECLTVWKKGGQAECVAWLGQTAPNGVIIDDRMTVGAQVMVDDVILTVQRESEEAGLNFMPYLMIEHRVYMPQIHEHNYGTLDLALWLPHKSLMYEWDYKHGQREVRARGNLQLIDYFVGLCHELGIDGHKDQQVTVCFRIVHPYCYSAQGSVDEWKVLASDLRAYINQLNQQAHEAMTAPTMSYGIWCRDCAAVGTCATARRAQYDMISRVKEPVEIDIMDGLSLAAERDILKDGLRVGKARLEAIEAKLEHDVANGDSSSGLALSTKQGNLAWSVPGEQAIGIAQQFGHDIAVTKPKTPTQARDTAPRELKLQFAEVLKGITHRPAGETTLINADDTISARAFTRRN